MYEKIIDDPSLVRDTKSGAVLNINKGSLEGYRKMKNSFKLNAELKDKVSKLENEVGDIRRLLLQLTESRK